MPYAVVRIETVKSYRIDQDTAHDNGTIGEQLDALLKGLPMKDGQPVKLTVDLKKWEW